MGDEGEKICPLCTEEMDLTDKQLKPCKCGYEICVWCWHNVMDMAEKDDMEGRCPACRTPYDKEKIVEKTVRFERSMAESNADKRLKPQKGKPKSSDGRKNLSSVRVIQRNLVYIIGIPSTLADEDLLQHKEYFGQYGKVMKVSMSRNAGGSIQYSSTNTCSVYITYSREEEAVRCIQSVHGYVLEDKPLKACFGTTKYCHAWLRNTPCNNPECLYLHEVGTQEDSFTKDEIISAYTRSRVQQITGATNNSLRRSGNVLPPPADELINISAPSSEKPIPINVSNNSSSHGKSSPPSMPIVSPGRSVSLPAAASWGLRASNGRPPNISSDGSTGSTKLNSDGRDDSFPPIVSSTTKTSTGHTDVGKKHSGTEDNYAVQSSVRSGFLENRKQTVARDKTITDKPEEVVRDAFPPLTACPLSENKDIGVAKPLIVKNSKVSNKKASASGKGGSVAIDEATQSLCSGISSIAIGSYTGIGTFKPSGPVSNHISSGFPGNSLVASEIASSSDVSVLKEPPSRVSESKGQVPLVRGSEAQEDAQNMNRPPLKIPEVGGGLTSNLPYSSDLHAINISNGNSWKGDDSFPLSTHFNVDNTTARTDVSNASLLSRSNELLSSNGYFENKVSSSKLGRNFDHSRHPLNVEPVGYPGSYNDKGAAALKNSTVDMGESSIISNIFSMDSDAWDVSLALPQNLAQLLGESEHGSRSGALRVKNSNQSRFSFARQDDFANQVPGLEPSSGKNGYGYMGNYSTYQGAMANGDLYTEKRQPGFSSYIMEESDTFPGGQSLTSPISRAPISAPPGFSIPSRATPPGFSSQDRLDTLDSASGNHSFESSMLRNQYWGQPNGNPVSVEDIEFFDPAIMAVGKGLLPNGIISGSVPDIKSTFSPQDDPRLQQLFMQQSISAQQNSRFSDQFGNGDRFSSRNDVYSGMHLRNQEQPSFVQSSPQSRNAAAHISNGHWEGGRNEFQSRNDLVLSELLRNENTLGYNKYFLGHEDLTYRIPSSGDLYNRAFGM
ncbi:hypothetical protein MKW94_016476 [Papaver nudicaule]|uniref:CCR4-NOT transcription complex subunit 4 n=1 Tax=Papaver nudicaule TaxID=74823 RepID=A0AA41S6V2_PAPNU|nr:hypothetical protein [Papaver nudicaule]